MTDALWLWGEELSILGISLVVLGLLLHGVRTSMSTSPGQKLAVRLVGVVLVVGAIGLSTYRIWGSTADPHAVRYIGPLLAAVVALGILCVLLGVRAQSDDRPGGDSSRHSVWSFGARWWFTAWLAATTLLVSTAIVTGLASSADDEGRYTIFRIELGSGSAGTTFFGWAYGVPVMAAVAVLTALVFVTLWVVSRPALPAEPAKRGDEIARRRGSVRTVLCYASGAEVFVLGMVWMMIASSARLTASFRDNDGRLVEVTTGFQALWMPLAGFGLAFEGIGIALMLLPAVQTRFRRPSPTGARTGVLERAAA
jgi:uncharacterized membrane protein